MKLSSIAQDWRERNGEPWKGPCGGKRLWGWSAEQSGSTPTQLRWDTRTKLLPAASRETGSCGGFWEINPKQLWSEEKRGEEPRAIPPQNSPLTEQTFQRAITLTVSWIMVWCDMFTNWSVGHFHQGKSWCWDCWSLFYCLLGAFMKDVRWTIEVVIVLLITKCKTNKWLNSIRVTWLFQIILIFYLQKATREHVYT